MATTLFASLACYVWSHMVGTRPPRVTVSPLCPFLDKGVSVSKSVLLLSSALGMLLAGPAFAGDKVRPGEVDKAQPKPAAVAGSPNTGEYALINLTAADIALANAGAGVLVGVYDGLTDCRHTELTGRCTNTKISGGRYRSTTTTARTWPARRRRITAWLARRPSPTTRVRRPPLRVHRDLPDRRLDPTRLARRVGGQHELRRTGQPCLHTRRSARDGGRALSGTCSSRRRATTASSSPTNRSR